MGEFVFRLPDVGEGLAEAELVQWSVAVGDEVEEDSIIAAVMTDKATVDIPSPVSGRVLWLGGDVGDILPIGADLIRFEVSGEGNEAASATNGAQEDVTSPAAAPPALRADGDRDPGADNVAPEPESEPDPEPVKPATAKSAPPVPKRAPGSKPLAAPSVRRRAPG